MSKKRPVTLDGKTVRVKTECGNIYVTLNWDRKNNQFLETKVTLGKSGGCVRGMLEFIGILLSMYLHSDLSIDEKIRVINKHAKDVSCGQPFMYEGEKYCSCLDLIAWFILDELKEQKKLEKDKQ